MNVRQLIAALQILPPDLPVVTHDGGTMQDRAVVREAILGDDEVSAMVEDPLVFSVTLKPDEYVMIRTF